MQRAGIAGATGYTGSELVQWIRELDTPAQVAQTDSIY